MNIKISNITKTTEIMFDNQIFVLNQIDFGSAAASLSTFTGINQIGTTITDRTISTRDINIIGYILADNEADMLSRKRDLQKMLSPLADFLIIVNDAYQLAAAAKSTIKYGVNRYENNALLAKFSITALCANPCFTEVNKRTVPIAYWRNKLVFPLVCTEAKPIVFGIREPSKIINIPNNSDISVGMIIEFKVKGDGVINPSLENLITKEKMQFSNVVMNKGDLITVNTNYGEKAITLTHDGVVTNFLHKMDIESDFLQLNVGDNYLKYDAEALSEQLSIDIEYLPRYLEV